MSRSFGRQVEGTKNLFEPLVNCEFSHIQWWYVDVSALTASDLGGRALAGGRRESVGGRSSIARSGQPGRGRTVRGASVCAAAITFVAALVCGGPRYAHGFKP